MKPYIRISIRTKEDTFEWDFGERLLESLHEASELIKPEQISHNPDKFGEAYIGISECQKYWSAKGSIRVNGSLAEFNDDFAWRRKKKVKCLGYVRHKKQNIKGKLVPGALNFTAGFSAEVDWFSLFKVWCGIFKPQLGMLHFFSGVESDPKYKNDSFQIGSFKSALNPEIPNIGWAMFYGNEFSQEVNCDGVSAAGFPVERLGDGYLIRVTNDINDVASDFLEFSRRRSELKGFFREDLFLVRDEPVV